MLSHMILTLDARIDVAGLRANCQKGFAGLAISAHLDAISLSDLRKREPAAMGSGFL